MGKLKLILLVCLAFLVALPISGASAEKRVALVIGNSAYRSAPPLANPRNDAGDMSAVLQKAGFDVIEGIDLDKRSMEATLARFARAALDADAALVFYAGHGMQHQGQNFLMPVDAKLDDEFAVQFETVRLDDILLALNQARGVRVLILDACRNNPLAERLARSGSTRNFTYAQGLAKIQSSQGMVVAYATQANEVAYDGAGRNSFFTGALVKEIEEPGLEVGQLFRRVAANVNRQTNGKQTPELSISLLGEFYIHPGETDVEAWTRLRQTGSAEELRQFMVRFPKSYLIDAARARIDVLEQAGREEQRRNQLAQSGEARQGTLARDDEQRRQADIDARIIAEREERERQAWERLEAEQRRRREEAARRDAGQAEAERARAAAADREAAERARREQVVRREADKPAPSAAKPDGGPLSEATLVASIQEELTRVGCYAGRSNEKWTSPATRRAVREFARVTGAKSPARPSRDFLSALKDQDSQVCTVTCSPRQRERNGVCVAKTCPAGQRLDKDGDCIDTAKPKSAKPRKAAAERKPAPVEARPEPRRRAPRTEAARPSGGGGQRCFTFSGQSFCE